MLPYLFGFLLSQLERLNCVSKFSPGISLSVCSCSVSSSGLVRIGTYLPFLSDVSYSIGVPVSSGISSSSSSSSSSSISLFARFLFWTIFSLPFRMSRMISSQGHISRPVRVGSVGSWGLSRRLYSLPVLFCSFFRSETVVPK